MVQDECPSFIYLPDNAMARMDRLISVCIDGWLTVLSQLLSHMAHLYMYLRVTDIEHIKTVCMA